MSDAQGPRNADNEPSIDELERDAIAATFRRAPRLGRVIGTGIGAGVVVGIVLAFALPNDSRVGLGMVAVLMALGWGMIGGLVAGAVATRMDGPLPTPPEEEPEAQD